MRGQFHLWAAGAVALGVLSLPIGPVAFQAGAFAAEAPAATPRIPGDTCFFEDAYWAELTPAEQAAWTSLGWTAASWDSSDVTQYPQSELKEWVDLTAAEKTTLMGLGYTEDTWDHVDDHCPKKQK